MTIENIIRERGITEIVHFTTNRGILGVLDSKALKARERLNQDQRLEYIFQPNAVVRTKDIAWLDYVNLSISRINTNFFSASGSWHRDKNIKWCVLSFKPEILTHAGVVFTTTNNIYTGVGRYYGADGLQTLFAPTITRWAGNVVARPSSLDTHLTTCVQAEVLYPGQVATEFLQKIYVIDEQHADEVAAQISVLMHPEVPIEIRPSIFA